MDYYSYATDTDSVLCEVMTEYIYIYIYTHTHTHTHTHKHTHTLTHTYIQGLSKRFEHLLLWPPRSPDLTHCDFSYGDTLKTMPTSHKLQDRIRAAVQTIEGERVS
jgi:hypothetical protein